MRIMLLQVAVAFEDVQDADPHATARAISSLLLDRREAEVADVTVGPVRDLDVPDYTEETMTNEVIEAWQARAREEIEKLRQEPPPIAIVWRGETHQ